MEKIIANEIAPTGVDQSFIDYIQNECSGLFHADDIIYYGYPVFKNYEHEVVKGSFCIVSKYYGVIIVDNFSTNNIARADENLSQLYGLVESILKKSKLLSKRKRLAVPFDTYLLSFSSDFDPDKHDLDNEVIESLSGFKSLIDDFDKVNLNDSLMSEIRSIVEGAKSLNKPSSREPSGEETPNKSDILIELEREITNFDVDQRRIAISLINGPQRIRGLAGSGKTIVLAMKAAHIHLQHPRRKILFTFYTKSLYLLIREMIDRFYRHFSGVAPDWNKIDVLHAWGGRNLPGVYYNACVENGHIPLDLKSGKSRDSNDPFKAVCSILNNKPVKNKYDYVLIDEAQDLPNDFFQICYKIAKGLKGENKNIVWAYDELQSIFNVYQRTPEELFGDAADGVPNISLSQFKSKLGYGQSNDLVLYKCYRNPLEILITAHALGFGIYSDNPVQMLENKEHWIDIGYSVEENCDYSVGNEVEIKRDRNNSPLSIGRFQCDRDLISYFKAEDFDSECNWVVDQIKSAIKDGLKPHDIMVICLDDGSVRSYFKNISQMLAYNRIKSNNLLASGLNAPPFFVENMVTLSTVHRAKGNESAFVIAIGIDAIYEQRKLRRGRNKIFTAFTRAKAWLRVSGIGISSQFFFNEIEKSLALAPTMKFEVPNKDQIDTIQRDLDSRPQEFHQVRELIESMRKKGISEEVIQMELSLINGGEHGK